MQKIIGLILLSHLFLDWRGVSDFLIQARIGIEN
jgi:hypothetical protein